MEQLHSQVNYTLAVHQIKSGLLHVLQPGDEIMADKGFLIKIIIIIIRLEPDTGKTLKRYT